MIIHNDSFRWTSETFEFPNLKQVNDEVEGRYYLHESDSRSPKMFSVTTVLGDDPTKKKALNDWRRRVGEQEANRISKFAAGRGTRVHSLLEKYLRKERIDTTHVFPHVKDMFYSGIRGLDGNVSLIHCLEQKLFSRNLGMAGTVDGVVEWKGVTSVLDFKTSKRVKTKDQIEDYFLQTCAYALMWKELTDKKIEQVVVFIMVEEETEPHVFVERIEGYVPILLKRVKGFYERRGLPLPKIFHQ